MPDLKKVNILEKLNQIHDHWHPRIAGELNGQQIRLVKVKGEFPFHKHDHDDEMFLVIHGDLILDFQDKQVELEEGEFLIVPKGVLHRPIAKEEVHLMMFVTAGNVNTGDLKNEQTLEADSLERI
ncbi:MAG: cupin domain-containing protein [Bacteroidetes bacterium]|nr:cupin domain-containing protein [Bacteroidota bacterium]